MDVVRAFLIEIQKEGRTAEYLERREMNMGTNATAPFPKVNIVALAGEIKKNNVQEKHSWTLLDCGGKSSVPVKCFDKKLLSILDRFDEGDFIQLKGYVSQSKNQQNGNWELLIVCNEIKTEPPRRAPTRAVRDQRDDDGIPF